MFCSSIIRNRVMMHKNMVNDIENDCFMLRRSFTFTASQEIDEIFGFAFLELFVFDSPVVVLVEESENLSQVLGLLLKELVENVEFSPLDLIIIVQIVCLQKFLFNLSFVEVLKMFGVDGSLDLSFAFLNHFKDYFKICRYQAWG